MGFGNPFLVTSGGFGNPPLSLISSLFPYFYGYVRADPGAKRAARTLFFALKYREPVTLRVEPFGHLDERLRAKMHA